MKQLTPLLIILLIFSFYTCQNIKDKSADSLLLNLTSIQTYKINTNERSTINGIEGTTLLFEPNSFVEENGNIYSGTAIIHLKEFRTLSSIFLEGLTTTSNGKMLETQGMLFLSITKPDSTKLILKQNTTYNVCFQLQKEQAGYELFYGEKKEKGINWQPAQNGSLGNLYNLPKAKFIWQDSSVTGYFNFSIDRLVFSSSKLGWINCDRFVKNQDLTSLYLKGTFRNNITARLIFYNYKSILPSTFDDGKIAFENFPINERVHLIIYSYDKNYVYLFEKEMITNNEDVFIEVQMSKTSPKDFLQKIREIETAVTKSNYRKM